MTLYMLLNKLKEISDNDPNYPDQIIFVLEEASEVQKEYCKLQRKKGTYNALENEMIDLLAATVAWFYKQNYDSQYVLNKIMNKYNRAIERYNNKGEL